MQRGFQAGELTPALWPRTDMETYAHGVKIARNVYIQREGGLSSRPGTVMVAPTKDSAAGRVKLIPFVFDNTVSYVLEFGNLYMRVYRNGAQIQASEGATPWLSTVNYVPGDLVSYSGSYYYCTEQNTNAAPPSTQWYLEPDGIFEIPTPYLIADVINLQKNQILNVMYLGCAGNGGLNYPIQKLICSGDTSWILTQPTFTPQTPPPGKGAASQIPAFADPSTPWFGTVYGYVNCPNVDGGNNGHFNTSYVELGIGSILVPGANGYPSASTDDARLGLDINRYMITATDLATGIESFPMQGTNSGWMCTGHGNGPLFGEVGNSTLGGITYCDPRYGDTIVRFNNTNSQPITSLEAQLPLVVNVPSTASFATDDYFTFQNTGIKALDGKVLQAYVATGQLVFTTVNGTGFPTTLPPTAEVICLASQVVCAPLYPSAGLTPTPLENNASGGQPVGSPNVAGEVAHIYNPTANPFPNGGFNGWSTGDDSITNFLNSVFSYGPLSLSWDATTVPGTYVYNIYRVTETGLWGLIGTSETPNFTDIGAAPNTSEAPPDYTVIGNGNIGNPSVVGAFQQRLLLANTPSNRDWVYASNAGEYETFTVTEPTAVDSDTVQFEIMGSTYNPVTQLTDNAFLLIFTETGEFSCFGAGNAYAPGPLTPTAIGLTQQGYYGANSDLPPITVGKNVLYIQALQSKVRELIFTYMFQGYVGEDDTVNSEHMFDGFTMMDWAYQQEPNSIIWVVRNDGQLLSMTYLPELKMKGWTHHDTDGLFESICVIPEGTEHAVYVEVNRNGVRFIERMANQTVPTVTVMRPVQSGPLLGTYVPKQVPDWTQWNYLDCATVYDGRGTDGATVTINYEYTSELLSDFTAGGAGFYLTVPYPGPTFTAGSVVILVDPATNSTYKCTVLQVVYDGFLLVRPFTNMPADLIPLSIEGLIELTTWAVGTNSINMSYLPNGTQVAVIADGSVLSSYQTATWLTIEGGVVTLPGYFSVVRAGLPYFQDVRSLDIDTTEQGQTAKDKPQINNRVACYFKDTRGVVVGTQPPHDDEVLPLENLVEFMPRTTESMGQPPMTKTGIVIASVDASYAYGANAFIRQPNPLPMTLTAFAVAGKYMIGS